MQSEFKLPILLPFSFFRFVFFFLACVWAVNVNSSGMFFTLLMVEGCLASVCDLVV